MDEQALIENQFFISIFIFIYIVIISVAIARYHNSLSKIKKSNIKIKHQLISDTEFKYAFNNELLRISKIKRKSFLRISIAGGFHILITFILSLNILYTLLTFTFSRYFTGKLLAEGKWNYQFTKKYTWSI